MQTSMLHSIGQNLLRIILLAAIAFPGLPAVSQNWQRVFGTSAEDVIWSVDVTTDGGMILAGYTRGGGSGQKDVLLVKTTSLGFASWIRVYGGSGDEEAYCVTQSADGGYVVSGYSDSYSGGNSDGLMFKVNASGNVVWSKTYGGAGKEQINQHIEAFGRIITAGRTGSYSTGDDDAHLTWHDQTGNIVWSRVFGGNSNDRLTGISTTVDNAIVFCGATQSYGNDYEPLLGKIDTSGTIQWLNTYGGGASADVASSVTRDNGNGFLVAGYTRSFGNGATDALFFRTDQNGSTIWGRTLGSVSDDAGRCAYNPMNGNYMLTGVMSGYGYGAMDYFVADFDNLGFLLWANAYGSVGTDANPNWQTDYPASNFVYDNGGGRLVFAEGSSGYSGNYDVFLMQTNLSGEIPYCSVANINPFQTTPAMLATAQTFNVQSPSGFDHLATPTEVSLMMPEVYSCGCSTNVSLGPDTAVCVGDFVVFFAGNGFDTYQWSTGASGNTITASTQGYYSVTVADNLGCTASDSVYLAVLPEPDDFDIGDDTVICDGFTVLLDAGFGYDLYMWQDGSQTQTYLASDSGVYAVSVSSMCGIATDSIHLTLMPLPSFTLGADQSICTGQNIVLNPGTFAGYQWQDNSSNPTFTATVSGNYSVTVTDSNGCKEDDAMVLTVQVMPSFDLGEGGDLCDMPFFLLDAGSGPGVYTYTWQDGSNLQTCTADQDGWYSVTVTNSCGSLSDSVYFPPCPTCIIDVPNAFSPNEDGINDVLYVVGNGFTRMQLLVYNRHGELVFETRDPAYGWDGYFKGKLQSTEVYYYYLNADCLNGQRIKKKGDITLLK